MSLEKQTQLYAQLQVIWKTLDDEFAFIAACNQGNFPLDADKKAYLATIAARTWQRTLDNRLGLSWEESQRLPALAESLPVVEHLLADKPEHMILHAALMSLLVEIIRGVFASLCQNINSIVVNCIIFLFIVVL